MLLGFGLHWEGVGWGVRAGSTSAEASRLSRAQLPLWSQLLAHPRLYSPVASHRFPKIQTLTLIYLLHTRPA